MIDSDARLWTFLAAQASLQAIVGARLYASLNLPAGYTPDAGAALVFNVRGGTQDYSAHVLSPSYQFRCFAATEEEARTLSRTLFDVLNDKYSSTIKWARMETIPTLLSDPSTGWPYVLAFYRISFGN